MKKIFILLLVVILFASCKKDKRQSDSKTITKFVFTKAHNPFLTEDVEGVITGNEIRVLLHGVSQKQLSPTIYYQANDIRGAREKDFTKPVIYTLSDDRGNSITYKVVVEFRDIYISGHAGLLAAYWKNGVKTILDDNAIISTTNGIVVHNNDVYVAGSSNYDNINDRAVYWKNGVKIELALTAARSNTTSISLYNNDVYITGIIADPNGGSSRAVYWKNGVVTELTDGSLQAVPSSIYVSGNDVYVTGFTFEMGKKIAAYWKNGNKVLLSGGSAQNANAFSLTTKGNDVYVFGIHNNLPAYWINGVINQLTINDNINMGINIGDDIYMVGVTNMGVATYWKNGVAATLDSKARPSQARFITNVGSDFYILGTTSSNIWINGKLTTHANIDGNPNSIFVKSN